MKKSKIIIPALGILVLSTAASITGTVAWFTAQTSYTATAGQFAVVRTTGDLKCVQTGGIGTQAKGESGDNNKVIETKNGYVLSDASFDHTTPTVIAPNRTGQKVGSKQALASATESNLTRKNKEGVRVLSAMTWNMAFSMEFGEGEKNYGLYFDASTSYIERLAGADPTDDANWSTEFDNTSTGKGFRMAFVGGTASSTASGGAATGSSTTTRVWADKQAAGSCNYVSQSLALGASLAGTSYVDPALMDSTCVLGAAATSTETASAANLKNYLGKFKAIDNETVTLNYTVVVWFEGTDPTVVDNKTLDTIRASISFVAEELAD